MPVKVCDFTNPVLSSFFATASPKPFPWGVPLLRALRLGTKSKYRDRIVLIGSAPLLGVVVAGQAVKTTLLSLPYLHGKSGPYSFLFTLVESFFSTVSWYGDKMIAKKARYWWGKAICSYNYHFVLGELECGNNMLHPAHADFCFKVEEKPIFQFLTSASLPFRS